MTINQSCYIISLYKIDKKKDFNIMVHPLRNLDGEFTFTRFRLELAMKEEFDKLAKKDARSATYLMNEALAEYLERHSDYKRH